MWRGQNSAKQSLFLLQMHLPALQPTPGENIPGEFNLFEFQLMTDSPIIKGVDQLQRFDRLLAVAACCDA